jgi:hypothetical protein
MKLFGVVSTAALFLLRNSYCCLLTVCSTRCILAFGLSGKSLDRERASSGIRASPGQRPVPPDGQEKCPDLRQVDDINSAVRRTRYEPLVSVRDQDGDVALRGLIPKEHQTC